MKAFFEACHASPANGQPLSAKSQSPPERPAIARCRERPQRVLRSVPAFSGSTRSPPHRGHGRRAPQQRRDPSPALRRPSGTLRCTSISSYPLTGSWGTISCPRNRQQLRLPFSILRSPNIVADRSSGEDQTSPNNASCSDGEIQRLSHHGRPSQRSRGRPSIMNWTRDALSGQLPPACSRVFPANNFGREEQAKSKCSWGSLPVRKLAHGNRSFEPACMFDAARHRAYPNEGGKGQRLHWLCRHASSHGSAICQNDLAAVWHLLRPIQPPQRSSRPR